MKSIKQFEWLDLKRTSCERKAWLFWKIWLKWDFFCRWQNDYANLTVLYSLSFNSTLRLQTDYYPEFIFAFEFPLIENFDFSGIFAEGNWKSFLQNFVLFLAEITWCLGAKPKLRSATCSLRKFYAAIAPMERNAKKSKSRLSALALGKMRDTPGDLLLLLLKLKLLLLVLLLIHIL